MDSNYFPIDHNALTTSEYWGTAWDDKATVHEAVQEAAWDENVNNLLYAIKTSKLSVEEIQGLYTDLGKLMFDNIDNYLFKVDE